MKEKQLIEIYLRALEKSLKNDNDLEPFEVKGPDWYIRDKKIREAIYDFEEKNYQLYEFLFSKVTSYFDARAHNYTYINNKSLFQYKRNILNDIEKLRNNLELNK